MAERLTTETLEAEKSNPPRVSFLESFFDRWSDSASDTSDDENFSLASSESSDSLVLHSTINLLVEEHRESENSEAVPLPVEELHIGGNFSLQLPETPQRDKNLPQSLLNHLQTRRSQHTQLSLAILCPKKLFSLVST